MEGDLTPNSGGENNIGLIPRALTQIFTTLEDMMATNAELRSQVKVYMVELYNEQFRDLLVDPSKPAKPLKLQHSAKRNSGCYIENVTEFPVVNVVEAMERLRTGSKSRQVAATLMNSDSSRSHAVFCIKVQVVEGTQFNEETCKEGQLFLVDLAGSEREATSGKGERQKKERVDINKSLTALGRVIQALQEKSGHIPYR